MRRRRRARKRARVILGQAEVDIAHLFDRAAQFYNKGPTALHLRAMDLLYEGPEEKDAPMSVPGTAVELMGLGHLLGAAALGKQVLDRETGLSESNGPSA